MLLAIVFYGLSVLILYVVVRMAVKHGILDADSEREADRARRRLARAVERSGGSGR
jgi:hypothetical protein